MLRHHHYSTQIAVLAAVFSDNNGVASSANQTFAHRCEAKLRGLGLWDNEWVFGPERGDSGGIRVVWLHERARCYEMDNHTSPEVGSLPPPSWLEVGCDSPIPEWDFVWQELLKFAPMSGKVSTEPENCCSDGHSSLVPLHSSSSSSSGSSGSSGALPTFKMLVEGALYVAHVAPWTPWSEVRSLEALAVALHACDAKAALLHLSDESGLKDPSYQLWPLVVRNYFHPETAARWSPERLVVAPLGYASGFLPLPPPCSKEEEAEAVVHVGNAGGGDGGDGGGDGGNAHSAANNPQKEGTTSNSCSKSSSSSSLEGPPPLPPPSSSSSSSSSSSFSRDLEWAFVGNALKQDRAAQLGSWALKMPKFAAHGSVGFLEKGSTVGSGSVARGLLERAVFCPCPCGFEHPDSFRFAEALEAGCLPVVGSGCGEGGQKEKETPPPPTAATAAGTQKASSNLSENYFVEYAEYATAHFGAPPLGCSASTATEAATETATETATKTVATNATPTSADHRCDDSCGRSLSPEQLIPVASSNEEWELRAAECAAVLARMRGAHRTATSAAATTTNVAADGDYPEAPQQQQQQQQQAAAALLEQKQTELSAWWAGVKEAVASTIAERLRECCL